MTGSHPGFSVSQSWDLEFPGGTESWRAAWVRDGWEETPSASSWGPSESGACSSAPEPAPGLWTIQAEIHTPGTSLAVASEVQARCGVQRPGPGPALEGGCGSSHTCPGDAAFSSERNSLCFVLPPEAPFSQQTIFSMSSALGLGLGGKRAHVLLLFSR